MLMSYVRFKNYNLLFFTDENLIDEFFILLQEIYIFDLLYKIRVITCLYKHNLLHQDNTLLCM